MKNAKDSVPIRVEGIHHYTISVAHLDESIKWYTEKLGFKLIYQLKIRGVGKMCYMQAPGFLLEIFEVSNPRPLPAYRSNPDTDLTVRGHKHFAILVQDTQQAVKELEALSVNVVSLKQVGSLSAAFITDSTGNLIELLQVRPSLCPADPNKTLGREPIALEKIHHVAINGPSRDEAAKWYNEKFGFAVAGVSEIAEIGLKINFMQAPGFILEIFEAVNAAPIPQERLKPYTDLQTLGNKYFSLGVKDAGKAAEGLRALGVEIVATEKADGVYRVFISDNSGMMIELFQLEH